MFFPVKSSVHIGFLEVVLELAEKLSRLRAQNKKPARQREVSLVGPATTLLRKDQSSSWEV